LTHWQPIKKVDGSSISPSWSEGFFVKPEKPFYLSTVHDREALTHTLRAFAEILPTMA